jgi:putative ABC transport system ATP-binding protein
MIECKNIQLTFGAVTIIDSLSFFIKEKQKACVVGESGTGKSSVLKMLQAYVQPARGEIYINNEKLTVKSVDEIRKNIIWIPQNFNLPVEKGIDLLKLMQLHQNTEKVEEILPELGLERQHLYTNFNEISGGQKQRVIISICLSIPSKILLMDEPTSSLDESSIDLLLNKINSLSDTTVLSASHNASWIKKTDKIIEL